MLSREVMRNTLVDGLTALVQHTTVKNTRNSGFWSVYFFMWNAITWSFIWAGFVCVSMGVVSRYLLFCWKFDSVCESFMMICCCSNEVWSMLDNGCVFWMWLRALLCSVCIGEEVCFVVQCVCGFISRMMWEWCRNECAECRHRNSWSASQFELLWLWLMRVRVCDEYVMSVVQVVYSLPRWLGVRVLDCCACVWEKVNVCVVRLVCACL